MTETQKNTISALRTQGYGYTAVANAVGLKKETVVAYCRKVGLTGTVCKKNTLVETPGDFCPECGSIIHQQPGKKHIRFCSTKCRISWWNRHPEKVKRKAVYSFVCSYCGKPFTAYGNVHRKYCCHECYITDRFKNGNHLKGGESND
ncbi:MAG: RNA polymerase subunit sigma-70 [[Eubacterium] siraeum]